MDTLSALQKSFRKLGSKTFAADLKWFFKTGPGEYGEGDKFLGIKVPPIRKFRKEHQDISLEIVTKLLASEYHEERFLALVYYIERFKKGDEKLRKKIFDLYLKNRKYVNNWDLVDVSSREIVGGWLFERNKDLLYKYARSRKLWERRIAVVSTYYFIKRDSFEDILALADILLEDPEDLMQKAVGWMLREAGNRDRRVLEDFLGPRYQKMPRTMLRYCIEKLPEKRRQDYLKGRV